MSSQLSMGLRCGSKTHLDGGLLEAFGVIDSDRPRTLIAPHAMRMFLGFDSDEALSCAEFVPGSRGRRSRLWTRGIGTGRIRCQLCFRYSFHSSGLCLVPLVGSWCC